MKRLLGITICFIFVFPINLFSWDDTRTHPHITTNATISSDLQEVLQDQLNLQQGMLTKIYDYDLAALYREHTINGWIDYGAEQEDTPMCRASNHFHNPLELWNQAGLTDTLGVVNAICWFGDYPSSDIQSSLTWATGFINNIERDQNTS